MVFITHIRQLTYISMENAPTETSEDDQFTTFVNLRYGAKVYGKRAQIVDKLFR